MTKTKIEWADVVWNPIRGCRHVSEGCRNCYAEHTAYRFSTRVGMPYHGLVVMSETGPRWTGDVRLVPDKLGEPLGWRKPRRVFANSMSDLFHPDVPFDYVAAVFGVMAATSMRHTFQVLTKRPERELEFFRQLGKPRWAQDGAREFAEANSVTVDPSVFACLTHATKRGAIPGDLAAASMGFDRWPLSNVWLGVSVENQTTAEERIPLLLQCPAAVHWISAEPLLDEVHLDEWLYARGLDWVVVGGESGPNARPCDVGWILQVLDQCYTANVPVFVKQLGARPRPLTLRDPKGGDPSQWPKHLRVRQYPAINP